MSLTADVKAAYLGPSSGRSEDTAYSLSTGPCWFRGANVGVDLGGSARDNVLLKFHSTNSTAAADTFLTVGLGSYYTVGFLAGAEECFMDITGDANRDSDTGIWVSCSAPNSDDADYAINNIMLTVFYS